MARKKKARVDASQTAGFGRSFGALLQAKGLAPEPNAQPEPSVPAEPSAPEPVTGRARLRVDRRGRRGKAVVLVEGLEGDLGPTARALRTKLGAGATVDEGVIVVQGDQLARVKAALVGLGILT